VLLGVLFGVIVISGPLMLASINRQTAWGISRRLRSGTPSVVRRTSYTAGVWNPAKPLGRGNATPNEPGWRATYSLTDDGLVKLELVHADGRRDQHVGPAVDAPDGLSNKLGLLPGACYLVGTGTGLGLGLVVGGASGAAVGAVAGFAITWFGLIIVGERWRSRLARRN
jgi:hypothetical protein